MHTYAYAYTPRSFMLCCITLPMYVIYIHRHRHTRRKYRCYRTYNSYYTQCSDKRQNRPVNPQQLPQHDTCPIHKFHPYRHYSIHAMYRTEREICEEMHYSYQRKCRYRYGWYVLYENSFCSQRFPEQYLLLCSEVFARRNNIELPSPKLWWRDRYKWPVLPLPAARSCHLL